MDAAIATIVPLFRASDSLFHRALDGVKTEDLLRRPHDGSNPLIWVAGHAMTSRASLTRMTGETIENPWSDTFARGVTVDANVSLPGSCRHNLGMGRRYAKVNGSIRSAR
jgi:hypothetical protein